METLFSTATALSHIAQSTLADAAYSTISTYEKLRSNPSSSSLSPSDHSSSSAIPLSSPSSLPSRRRDAWTYPPFTSAGLIEGGGSLREPSEASSSSGSSSSDRTGSTQVLGEVGNQILNAARVEEKSILRFAGMSKEEVDQLLWDYRTVFTAGTASLVSTVASFPFDSVKSRLQVKHYPSIWSCAKAVFREEGIQGFFRGVFIPLITISFVRTSSFSIYVNTKESLHNSGRLADKSRIRDVALSGMAGGATSGVIISCGSAPFELVKVQRQLEYLTAVQRGLIGSAGQGGPQATTSSPPSSAAAGAKKGPPAKFQARSGFQAAADIYRHQGGIRGFYIGFPLHLTRDTLGTALYFGSYDSIRSVVNRNVSSNGSLFGVPGPFVSFLSGSTAGILSWLIVYPVDLLKTNVQQRKLSNHPKQLTGYQLFTHLLRARPPADSTKQDTAVRRFLRLYRGLGVSALRSFISHGLTWTIIEALSDRISQRTGKDVMAARG